ncbi:PREDICTED: mitochondrial fission factor [Thamnophis sirtalis]|uniref:Mitochondrial fission factor n=1 Tax=Thamnophis sirtalis TaxID=35019 RepID=A0A6I9X1Y9_9SAUR|nr:PREDICTED: mitochondrial fission factor [Thamnophis sirtalis]
MLLGSWMERHLRSIWAEHITGIDNHQAAWLSRKTVDNGEWSLSLELFQSICQRFGRLCFSLHLLCLQNSVTPSPQQVRVCSPQKFSEDGPSLYSTRGILSLIQSSTRRAYQQVLDVLDENRRPVLRGGSAAVSSSSRHHDEARYTLSNIDTSLEGASEDMTVVDAASLRRQIIKLNRRLQLLEEENKERAKREMIMYSITVAFWLLNSWLWFRR